MLTQSWVTTLVDAALLPAFAAVSLSFGMPALERGAFLRPDAVNDTNKRGTNLFSTCGSKMYGYAAHMQGSLLAVGRVCLAGNPGVRGFVPGDAQAGAFLLCQRGPLHRRALRFFRAQELEQCSQRTRRASGLPLVWTTWARRVRVRVFGLRFLLGAFLLTTALFWICPKCRKRFKMRRHASPLATAIVHKWLGRSLVVSPDMPLRFWFTLRAPAVRACRI